MPEFLAGVGAASGGGSDFLTQAVGLFNIFVGLMLVGAILIYGGGFVMWVTRLGTWPGPRDQAIELTAWGPTILFVLIVLLAIVQFLQGHPQAGIYTVAVIAILLAMWLIIFLVRASAAEKKEE